MEMNWFAITATVLGCCASSLLHAETTAMTQIIPDEKVTLITCELTQAPKHTDIPVLKTAAEAAKTVGTYHYNLWLPKGPSSNTTGGSSFDDLFKKK